LGNWGRRGGQVKKRGWEVKRTLITKRSVH